MKKEILKIVGLFVFAIAMFINVQMDKQEFIAENTLENIAALAMASYEGDEPRLSDRVWFVYKYYQNGNCYINCTLGGNERCLLSDHC